MRRILRNMDLTYAEIIRRRNDEKQKLKDTIRHYFPQIRAVDRKPFKLLNLACGNCCEFDALNELFQNPFMVNVDLKMISLDSISERC